MKIKITKHLFYPPGIEISKKWLQLFLRTLIFLLGTTVFGLHPGSALSQSAKVQIEEDKSLSVDEVFDLIKAQTDYRFVYRSDMFKNFPKVSLKKGTIAANDLLRQSLSNGNFNVQFTGNNTLIISDTVVPKCSTAH